MHKELRQLLREADGISEFVIAVNLDIRGFSSFSTTVESKDTAVYLKKIYMTLIDNYFQDASYFKPTGDGLLITIPYDEKNLEEVAQNTINSCLNALYDFSSICDDDPMINYEVPDKIGIGIARGTVSRIANDDITLDYSGRALNLASRLMDLARPNGIVFDSTFIIQLLSEEQLELFEEANVYIKGIAERSPITIYYTKDLTTISPLNKHPLDKVKWKKHEIRKKFREIKKLRWFKIELDSEPWDENEIQVSVTYPTTKNGRKLEGYVTVISFKDYKYGLEATKPFISINFPKLVEILERYGVKTTWPVVIEIQYPER